MRAVSTRTFINMCHSLLRELRNSPDLKLNDRVLMMQRLSQTYKSLKDLSRDGEELSALGKQIAAIKQELERQKGSGLELVKDG